MLQGRKGLCLAERGFNFRQIDFSKFSGMNKKTKG